MPQPIDTPTSHLGFCCIVRAERPQRRQRFEHDRPRAGPTADLN
jgi:hypothetical protein